MRVRKLAPPPNQIYRRCPTFSGDNIRWTHLSSAFINNNTGFRVELRLNDVCVYYVRIV